MYERDIKCMDLILTNSLNTKQRIKKYLWVEAKVLYPPVDLDEFKYIWQKDYYLSFARLSDAKRVDKVAEAFIEIPDKRLVIIYWENDPQRQKIFDIIAWYENIKVVTLRWNRGFTEYIGNCIATIYIPINEDFWMSPVESMAAWKPVLWVSDGWLKETIIDKKTWILISKEAKVDDIKNAVHYLSPERCLSMKENCQQRARDFSLEIFTENLRKYIFD